MLVCYWLMEYGFLCMVRFMLCVSVISELCVMFGRIVLVSGGVCSELLLKMKNMFMLFSFLIYLCFIVLRKMIWL